MKSFIITFVFFQTLIIHACSWQKNELIFGTGWVENAYTKVCIRQPPYPNDTLVTPFETKPFQGSPYYQVRYTCYLRPTFGIGAELDHHKLYMEEKPDYIQRFDITNGFNLIYINQIFRVIARKYVNFSFILGEGIVISHPESTIRGNVFSEHGGLTLFDTDGYFVSGLTLQTAFNLSFRAPRFWGIYMEGKGTYSYATVPIYQGIADVTNVAFHFTGGLSIFF